jgi:hypothetical protein
LTGSYTIVYRILHGIRSNIIQNDMVDIDLVDCIVNYWCDHILHLVALHTNRFDIPLAQIPVADRNNLVGNRQHPNEGRNSGGVTGDS